ncbi:hypothetical protein J6590_107447, partial [Homalodisca vitripennis]
DEDVGSLRESSSSRSSSDEVDDTDDDPDYDPTPETRLGPGFLPVQRPFGTNDFNVAGPSGLAQTPLQRVGRTLSSSSSTDLSDSENDVPNANANITLHTPRPRGGQR